MTLAQVLVVTGPPAAGKTSAARLLAGRGQRSVRLHADDFWGFIANGYVEPWLPASAEQNEVVMRAVCGSAVTFATGGYEVVLDGVLGPWALPELVHRCHAENARLDYAILLPLDTLLANLRGRSGHGFTSADAATQMHREFSEAAAPLAHHVIDPAGLTPEQVAEAIETARNTGRLRLA